jgi:nucleoside-diphosphate-sugar epimerase
MILLTGATGFIGSNILKNLELLGKSVRPVCRNVSSLKVKNISGWVEIGNINGDTNWMPALNGVEVVIHSAGRAHVTNDKNLDSLSVYREINVDATINLARQAVSSGVKRFIFISSIKVNGEFTEPNHPFHAHDIPTPQDAYGISKCEAEQALQDLSRKTGLEVVIIRPPLVYGQSVKGNLSLLIKLIQFGIPLPLGSINNKRSLVSVDNLSDLIIHCLYHPNARGHTFLVSDDLDLSSAEIAKKIANSLGVNVRIISIPQSLLKFLALCTGKGRALNKILGTLQVDITKTKNLLNWAPPIGINESIKRMFSGNKSS